MVEWVVTKQEQEQFKQEQEGPLTQEDEFLYKNFINTLKAKNTKEDYTRRLKYFLEFLGVKNSKRYSVLVDPNKNKKIIESDIKSFLTFLQSFYSFHKNPLK